MDAAYLRAAMPEPYRIFGKLLKPFCLGHEILLQRFKNNFSIESRIQPELPDLLTGVFICSQRFSYSVTLERFSIPRKVRENTKKLGGDYLYQAYALFSSYINDSAKIPDFYSIGDPKKQSVGSPTIQSVKVSLMANLGLSEDEALNTPFSLAFWNHLTWAESNRAIQIIDDAEIEKQKRDYEMMARQEEKLEAFARRVVSLSA